MNLELTIIKNEISELSTSSPKTFYTEDLYQAIYKNYTIDCGWYSSGCFIAFLIKDAQWDLPILRIETRDLLAAQWSINACIDYLKVITTNA